MDEYITPNYKTIGTVEQRKIRELYTSSLLNAFTQQDYLDAIALIGRVIDRLEKLEKMSLIYIKNTIEILNNILESDTFPLMSGYYTVIKKHDLRSVISLLSDLQTENEKLQKMYQEEKVICHETQLELERMKKIMRKNGIMIISSKYPGSTEKWNIQKPCNQKEEL